MEYLKHTAENRALDRAAARGVEPNALTPKSERPRTAWGSLLVSLQTSRGLCGHGKCFRKQGHGGEHYPV
jgi:hypothetical protein